MLNFGRTGVAAGAVFLILILINFHGLTSAELCLDAGDAPLFQVRQFKQMMDEGRVSSANPVTGLGAIGPILIGDVTALVYRVVPEAKAEEILMSLSVFWISMFFFLFLRDRRYRMPSALVGAVALGFSVVLLSLAKAGHTGKFTGMAYAVGALWLMGRSISGKSWGWALWAGLFVGLSLAQSRDFAMLLLFAIGAFWVRELVALSIAGKKFQYRLFVCYVLAGIVAVVVMWPVMQILVPGAENKNTAEGAGKEGGAAQGPAALVKEDKWQKWDWATQWSLPSDELTKLICPSYCGLDSWNSEAPYWGRMGRSAGWEKQKNQPGLFRNFTQTNEYLGVVVFILALCGFAGFLPRYRNQLLDDEPDSPPHDGVFWAVAGVLALLLALGKYGPLYRAFYELPMMSTIRNPVKFMHLVSLAVAMLAAQGAYLVEQISLHPARDRRWRLAALLVPAGLVTFFFVSLSAGAPWDSEALTTRWVADGFGRQIDGIKAAMRSGVSRSLFLSVLVLGVLAAIPLLKSLFERPAVRNGLLLLLAALAGWDAVTANRNYVCYYKPGSLYRSNGVIEYLKTMPEYRCKFMPLHFPAFNQWNSLLVPYFFFKSADIPAESRRNDDLQAFYNALGSNPRRLWQLTGVRSLVLPAQHEAELFRMLGPGSGVVRRFNLVQDETGGIATVFATAGQAAQFSVLENREAIPCGKWYAAAERMNLAQMFVRMQDPAWDPAAVLLLEEGVGPVPAATFPTGTGSCRLVEYQANRLKLETDATVNGWVLINDYYDGKWSAEIDSKPATVYRADGVFRAVYVPGGKHLISMSFCGNTATFWVPFVTTAVLLFVSLGSALYGFFIRRHQGT